MKSHSEFTADLSDFHGVAPLFPLPNVVLFPYTALPLRVFEERYCQMVAETLEEGRWIAMALLKPGAEEDSDEPPAIHDTVCLGRITTDQRLESGEYNIIVTGVQRAVIVEEFDDGLPYRTAEIDVYKDFYAINPLVDRESRHTELMINFRRLFPNAKSDSLFSQVLDAGIPLGVACDLLASALRLSVADRQLLLEEIDVDLRSDLLLDKICKQLPPSSLTTIFQRRYPPTFSLN